MKQVKSAGLKVKYSSNKKLIMNQNLPAVAQLTKNECIK